MASQSTEGVACDAATMPSRNGEAKAGGSAAAVRVRSGCCVAIDMRAAYTRIMTRVSRGRPERIRAQYRCARTRAAHALK